MTLLLKKHRGSWGCGERQWPSEAPPSTQWRDCSQGHREKGLRSYIYRTLESSHPGLGRQRDSLCLLPALGRPHSPDTQCVLLTQSILSTVPRPHPLPTLLSGSRRCWLPWGPETL